MTDWKYEKVYELPWFLCTESPAHFDNAVGKWERDFVFKD
jgi:hypothetical protein